MPDNRTMMPMMPRDERVCFVERDGAEVQRLHAGAPDRIRRCGPAPSLTPTAGPLSPVLARDTGEVVMGETEAIVLLLEAAEWWFEHEGVEKGPRLLKPVRDAAQAMPSEALRRFGVLIIQLFDDEEIDRHIAEGIFNRADKNSFDEEVSPTEATAVIDDLWAAIDAELPDFPEGTDETLDTE